MVQMVAIGTEASRMSDSFPCGSADYWGSMFDVLRHERSTRGYFAASAMGSLAAGAAYVAVMLVAFERLGSAWAASAILLAEMLPGMFAGPLLGAWLDRRDRRRWAAISE